MSTHSNPRIPYNNGEPLQGDWSEKDFLKFHTNRMAELVNGRLEMLPMPTLKHQRILLKLLDMFRSAAEAGPGGLVLFAPLPINLLPGTIREPDLLYIAPANQPGPEVDYPSHIDLAVEIVSEGSDARIRDYDDKRADYAKAHVAEYWIVDPQEHRITVLVLEGDLYIEHGVFGINEVAIGKLLSALSVDVAQVMNA